MDFMVTNSGTITAVVDGNVYNVPKDHKYYEQVKETLRVNDEKEFVRLVNIVEEVKKFTRGKVEIKDGVVFYNGEAVHNALTSRILQLMAEKFPFEPMLKFLENLMENPSSTSVSELYSFLEHRNLPITEDGHFLAYKRVRDDWTDIHSGKISYTIGSVVEMPRNMVDDNTRNHCSRGLHVGALSYVEGYGIGGHIIICKVNPRDCVSVPNDHNFTKLRTCKLEVLEEFKGELTKALYNPSGQVSSQQYEEWDSDFEDDEDDYENDSWLEYEDDDEDYEDEE